MKKVNCLLISLTVLLLTSCSTATPEMCYSVAVLNTNMIYGFADEGMLNELASPPVKSDGTKDGYMAMTRKEVLESKIAFIEKAFENVKALKKQDDNAEMLEASIAAYQFVLPVYKSDYMRLAAMHDAGAADSLINEQAKNIHKKNYSTYEKLSSRLFEAGKKYADKNNIKVNYVNPLLFRNQ